MNSFPNSTIHEATSTSLVSSFFYPTIAESISICPTQPLIKNSNILNYPATNNIYFGAGFAQTLNTFTIRKDQLPGLTVASNNRAESLVVGLLNKWSESSNDPTLKIDASFWGTGIEDGVKISTFVVKLFNQLTATNNELPDVNNNVDPDNY